MSLLLENTTAAEVSKAISSERHRLGATATGMVLTLVIITNEENQSDATRAATFSANQHPCRILVVIPRPGRGKPELDAEISVGDREGPGETVKLRLKGPLAHQVASVILPLLLADTPVVAWWAGPAPAVPADDPVGQLAQRRITDSTGARKPADVLLKRAEVYQPGDTDLAWTRATPWRSMLATALDEPFDPVISAEIRAQNGTASAELMAAWLHRKLDIPVAVRTSRGPGITEVSLMTESGEIELARPDGLMATLTRPNGMTRKFPLPRRELRDLVSEELRRLDADEVYAETLESLAELMKSGPGFKPESKRAAAARKAAESAKPASKKTAEKPARGIRRKKASS